MINEKRAELERLNSQHESLQRVEAEQKALIEKLCGVPIEEIRLFNEEFSTFQLEGPKMCGECGLISTGGAPPKTLTMMVTWTLFVREDPPDNAATAKAREMGLDLVRQIPLLFVKFSFCICPHS